MRFSDEQLDDVIRTLHGWRDTPSRVLTPADFPAWFSALSETDQEEAVLQAINRMIDRDEAIDAILDVRQRDYRP